MPVEWFNAKLGAPSVSVGPNGLVFTPAARTLLGNPEYVRIGVDAVLRRVCVMPTEAKDDCALAFSTRADKNDYVRLSQRDIARFLVIRIKDLSIDKTRRYLASWNATESCLDIWIDRCDSRSEGRSRGRAAGV